MNKYIENPKTKQSGIVCAIPQTTGLCPNNCPDCFYNSGRSYLEPLKDNLPNMPEPSDDQIVRVNDGFDSNIDRENCITATAKYKHRFYNTAIPNLDFQSSPVVLTVNPGQMTDESFHKIAEPPKNLMAIRIRANMWNTYDGKSKEGGLVNRAVKFYSEREVPILLTFMAYHDAKSIPKAWAHCYSEHKRTLNFYWTLKSWVWKSYMEHFKDNKWVYSCGRFVGGKMETHCRFCGHCIREYFATITRMNFSETQAEDK